MLTVEIPRTHEAERRYIVALLLSEFLGLDVEIRVTERTDTRIATGDGTELVVADGLFALPEHDWLQPSSLPKQPLKVWRSDGTPISARLVDQHVPVIYGEDPDMSSFLTIRNNHIRLGLDVFGSAFFLLTRYEEVAKLERDDHDRFPSTASLARQEGFLERPLVNEYLEILFWCVTRLWPSVQRKRRAARVILSHDVDWPYGAALSASPPILKSRGGQVVAWKRPASLLERCRFARDVRSGNLNNDPYNTFDWIMDSSERNNLASAFYFLAGHTGGRIDGYYSIDQPWIRTLMRRIHRRGHEIGLHTSYMTYLDPTQTKREFDSLLRVCDQESIHQVDWGGRQHHLRWQAPTTWQNWENAGLAYDSTLTFVDHVGFRCGTCYEYPVFNLKTRQPLTLRERPLIVMEVTLFLFMGLSWAAALERLLELASRIRLFDGSMTLLIHNNHVVSQEEKAWCEAALRELSK